MGVVEADLDAGALHAPLAQRALRVPLAPRQAEVAHAAVAPRARVFWETRGTFFKAMPSHRIRPGNAKFTLFLGEAVTSDKRLKGHQP